MMEPSVEEMISEVYPFSVAELAFMQPFIRAVNLKKNEYLVTEGQNCNHLFLVESGGLRSYFNNDGAAINLSFTFEGQFVTSFEAYLHREPSRISIQALEPSVIWAISSRTFPKEHAYFTTFSTFIRRIFIRILSATEERYLMMRINSPAKRYELILEKKPELLQRVSLTYLASYLGITRETLSRIRSNTY